MPHNICASTAAAGGTESRVNNRVLDEFVNPRHEGTHVLQEESVVYGQQAAQEWTNRTLISNEQLICSKMCFTKTEVVQ